MISKQTTWLSHNDRYNLQSYLPHQGKSTNMPLSMAFGYSFQFFQQICYFWESRHFGVVNYADCRLAYVAVTAGKKIFGFWTKNMLRDKLITPNLPAAEIFYRNFSANLLVLYTYIESIYIHSNNLEGWYCNILPYLKGV